MKALLFTCMLVPWLVAASARRFDQDSQLIPGSLHGRELSGYISYHLKSRRARVRFLLFTSCFSAKNVHLYKICFSARSPLSESKQFWSVICFWHSLAAWHQKTILTIVVVTVIQRDLLRWYIYKPVYRIKLNTKCYSKYDHRDTLPRFWKDQTNFVVEEKFLLAG